MYLERRETVNILLLNILDNSKNHLFWFDTFDIKRSIDVLDLENQSGSGEIRTGYGFGPIGLTEDAWHQKYKKLRLLKLSRIFILWKFKNLRSLEVKTSGSGLWLTPDPHHCITPLYPLRTSCKCCHCLVFKIWLKYWEKINRPLHTPPHTHTIQGTHTHTHTHTIQGVHTHTNNTRCPHTHTTRCPLTHTHTHTLQGVHKHTQTQQISMFQPCILIILGRIRLNCFCLFLNSFFRRKFLL